MSINTNKIAILGAGKIGRSLIGPLFSNGGYEVVFIDKDKALIDELNKRRNYNLVIKSDESEYTQTIANVRGGHLGETEMIANEIATAGIVSVSVGVNNLNSVFPVLGKGLTLRYDLYNEYPLDIIIAENTREGDKLFQAELVKFLPPDYPLQKLVGLVETSIGKMVPIMGQKDVQADMLQVFAEPYNTLILDKLGFKNPIPDIQGLAPKENMKAWVDRKLFIHNLGHVAIAYAGHLIDPNFVYVWEALEDRRLFEFAKETMQQASTILMNKYPREFTRSDLDGHIDDLLNRFRNKALKDTIFRVGCDLKRKLGPHDRLAGAIRLALESNLMYDKILFALVCGCHFKARDEDGKMLKEDVDFHKEYKERVALILNLVCGFDRRKHGQLFKEAETIDDQLSKGLKPLEM
jgi:mannitol-1-phosphate 5-dehydrogenase